MKLTKPAIFAIAVTLVLGVSSARAAIGFTTNYSKLNFTGTITTNSPGVEGTSWKNPVKTAKFGNKQLLDLFAGWTNAAAEANVADRTVDPWKTAQLVIGWDWDSDVLVVDKTGTNVLFDASVGVGNNDAYFFVDFFNEYGVGNESGKDVDGSAGYYNVVDTGTAFYELHDNYIVLDYTDISGFGGNQQSFKQNWDKNGDFTTWTDPPNSFIAVTSFTKTGTALQPVPPISLPRAREKVKITLAGPEKFFN